MTFNDLKLSAPLLKAVSEAGYETPSPIQASAIPPVLEGRDLMGCAQTGTGKTAAFALPMLDRLSAAAPRKKGAVRALILTPTRELALQIGESFDAYGKYLKLRSTVIFGGVGQAPQVEAIRKGVDILIACPGRLNDLIGQGHIDLSNLEVFVLDEADRMLDMGFVHDVKKVIAKLPAKRQNLMFSATMPKEIEQLAAGILHDPAFVKVDPVSSTVERIDQSLYFVEKGNKKFLLPWLIKNLTPPVQNALVFSRTKHGADKIARDLTKQGITAAAIHGNKSQTARVAALEGFKEGKTRVLVATDIAARGIDISELSHVFNYDLPEVPETYVHRIGRTGRAGRGGTAISFCDINEKDELKAIEKLIGRAIPVVEGHPWPMEVLEPLPRDKKGRVVNPEDAEARAAAKERRRQRDAANKAAAEARKAKANQKVLEQPPQPEPAGETSAKKRRKRGQRNSATLEEALTATAPARPVQAEFADFHKPDPLASDVIMDATARLLAPRGRAQAVPKKDKPVEQPAKKRKKAARPPEPPAKPEPQAARKRKGGGRHGGRGRPPEVTLRTNGQKDSTEQPSLMKPYYLSHD